MRFLFAKSDWNLCLDDGGLTATVVVGDDDATVLGKLDWVVKSSINSDELDVAVVVAALSEGNDGCMETWVLFDSSGCSWASDIVDDADRWVDSFVVSCKSLGFV